MKNRKFKINLGIGKKSKRRFFKSKISFGFLDRILRFFGYIYILLKNFFVLLFLSSNSISGRLSRRPFFRKMNLWFKSIFSKLGFDIPMPKFYQKLPKDTRLLIFFAFIFFIILLRLFRLQVVEGSYYQKLLTSQHYTKSLLKAKRGNVFLTDKSGKTMKLTENVDLYTVYVDPKFVKDKQGLINILSPIFYKHFCELNGLAKPTKEECIKNIEDFTQTQIFPEEDKLFYMSGENQLVLNLEDFNDQKTKALETFDQGSGIALISKRLDDMVKGGIREKNYFGFFDKDELLDRLKSKKFAFVEIVNNNYIYFIPSNVSDLKNQAQDIYNIFKDFGYTYQISDFLINMSAKETRYIKLIGGVNSQIAKEIKDQKDANYKNKIEGIPLLHGIGLEKSEKRFYPYGTFLSNVLGYMDKNGEAFYGLEKYFDEQLNGKDGDMIGLAVPWLGEIGSNSIEISKPVDGYDLYLTIDPVIQKEAERIMRTEFADIRPDSAAMIVMDPYSGKIVASVNMPDFDPNFYDDIYKIKPLSYEDRILIDDNTFVDIPILILTGDKLRVATTEERLDPNLKKFIFKNRLGPQTFVDKTISMPYEPGSIFKAFTLSIGMDTDEINMYDYYSDPKSSIDVGPFTIKNVHSQCKGTLNFMQALEWSCNVGMVKIGQKIGKEVFYSYLQRLGLGKRTGIELFGEEEGSMGSENDTSLARFYNNTFGQGILATPIQMAVGYSALVNGGYMIKPTIVEKLYDKTHDRYIDLGKKVLGRIFKQETSDNFKEAIFQVVNEGDLKMIEIKNYTLGGKTGTSQIAYKGTYRGGNGWTNSSFMGIITRDNTKYVVAIQLRRPRKSQWGLTTAGKIFNDLARFIITYEGIKK